MERTLNRQNIDSVMQEYVSSIEGTRAVISGLTGVKLFQYLKRQQIGAGPYPHVTLFEAANRIMTDLVILRGVKWLLESQAFPFDEYVVEYGNEDSNDHDIRKLRCSRNYVVLVAWQLVVGAASRRSAEFYVDRHQGVTRDS